MVKKSRLKNSTSNLVVAPRALANPLEGLGILISILMTCFVIGSAVPVQSQEKSLDAGEVKARGEIENTLADACDAWRTDDFDRFMHLYDDSTATTYVTGTAVLQGIDAIRKMYRREFGLGAGGQSGRLALEIADFRLLGADYAFVAGQYRLVRPDGEGGEMTGLVTLVFKRMSGGWRVIADHAV